MKTTHTIPLIAAFIGSLLFASITKVEAQTLTKMGSKQGRSYHEFIHEDGCKSCHDQGLKLPPTDNFCSECHDKQELMETTAVKDNKHKWRNPHNNMHYGDKVPCIECHSEHKPKKPLCASCHNFEFKNFKEN